jgi:tetratricopeptide (TPR) repeat protein
MNFAFGLAITLLGTAVVTLVQPYQRVMAQSATQVANTAKQITVLIEGQNPGSGVIIRREGTTYWVLTARHVVATKDEYHIVTPDGKKYLLNYNTVKPLPGVDLAILEFTSTSVYPVARLGNSRNASSGTIVYVAGFPAPTAAINRKVFNFTEGKITANSDYPLRDGYALVYSNYTLPGMSGGPVLNGAGEVIGIHGKGDTDTRSSRATANPNVALKTGFNLAIPMSTFLRLVSSSGIVGFAPPSATPSPTLSPADNIFLQANAKYQKKDYPGAIADYDQAIRLAPKHPNIAEAYHNRGMSRYILGDKPGAVTDFDQALRHDPNQAKTYNGRGLARHTLGDRPGAIADFDQAIRLNPSYSSAYNHRGQARFAQGDKQGAIADFDQAIRLSPNYASAYNNRGLVLFTLGNKDEAIADFDQAIRLIPTYAAAYRNRGMALAASGNKQGAIADYQKALELARAQGNQQLLESAINNLKRLQQL